ncbi:hypothetical protein BDE02_06G106000 [Populus trichocarpa]|nr:hypothetical protein BDE02_06G106000 [Populus trichocarpa]
MRANSLSCVVSCLSTEEIQFNKFIILQKFFKRGGLNKKLRLSYSGMGSKGQLLHPQETTVTLILLLSRQPYNQVETMACERGAIMTPNHKFQLIY